MSNIIHIAHQATVSFLGLDMAFLLSNFTCNSNLDFVEIEILFENTFGSYISDMG